MKTCSLITVSAIFMVLTHLAGANQADDTTITITGQTAGATPFISKLTLEVSNTTVLKSIQFAIDAETGFSHPATVRHLFQRLPCEAEDLNNRHRQRPSLCRSTDFTLDIRISSD